MGIYYKNILVTDLSQEVVRCVFETELFLQHCATGTDIPYLHNIVTRTALQSLII